MNGLLRKVYEQKWRESSYRDRSPAIDAKDDILRELALLLPDNPQWTPGEAKESHEHWGRGEIADVGCGSGRFLRVLEEAGYQPTGIDISANCLDADMIGYPFICSPVTDLPEGMEFDAVVCLDMLEHVPGELLLYVLTALRKLSNKAVIGVSNYEDAGKLHCSLYPPDWWEASLKLHWANVVRAKVTTRHFRQAENNWFLWRCWA